MSFLSHSTIMKLALDQAAIAEANGEVPIGAIIVNKGKVIGEGYNQTIMACDPSAHAEIVAIRQAANQLGNHRILDATLYVTLEPCVMCLGALIQARVRSLVFGAFDQRVGAVVSVFQLLDKTHFNHTLSWQGGIMAEQCASQLRQFFQKRRVEQRKGGKSGSV